jgi:hypothetical protein
MDFMLQRCVDFSEDDAVYHFVEALVLVKFQSKWKKKFENDLFAFRTGKHVLDTDSWNHSDAATKDL